MTEQTMIERVASAMYDWEAEINNMPERWGNIPGRAREEWYAMAHAVLAAMREPTESMLNYAVDKLPGCYPDDGCCMRDDAQTWRAMIDAALAE